MKKQLASVLALVMALSLVGCGSSATVTTTEKAPDGSVMEVSKDNATLVMCTNAEFPPYEYKEGGEFLGIDVEIARAIGNKLGKKVDILDIQFDTCIPTVQSGKADFAMAGMTVTEDRKQNVDFSSTYQTAVQSVIVLNDNKIVTIDDLKGNLIGVQQGTTGDIYATGDYGEENVKRFMKGADAVQALKVGKIDAVIIDDQVAKSLVEATNGDKKQEDLTNTDLVILDTAYAEEEYAIAVKKGNTDLLNKINNAIDEMKNNGELQAIVDKYIK